MCVYGRSQLKMEGHFGPLHVWQLSAHSLCIGTFMPEMLIFLHLLFSQGMSVYCELFAKCSQQTVGDGDAIEKPDWISVQYYPACHIQLHSTCFILYLFVIYVWISIKIRKCTCLRIQSTSKAHWNIHWLRPAVHES